jgi:hypothetical protein
MTAPARFGRQRADWRDVSAPDQVGAHHPGGRQGEAGDDQSHKILARHAVIVASHDWWLAGARQPRRPAALAHRVQALVARSARVVNKRQQSACIRVNLGALADA